MNITIEDIKESDDFMNFWNSVYGNRFDTLSDITKYAFMEVAYFGFIAGMNFQRSLYDE